MTVFTCEDGLTYCADNKGCYDKTGRCDGIFDCRDHSDEYNCQGHIPGTAKSMHKFFDFNLTFLEFLL